MPLIRAKLRQGTPWWLRQQQAAPFIKLMGFIFLTLAIYQRRRRRDGGRKRDQIPRRLQQLGEEGGWWGRRVGGELDSCSLPLFPSLSWLSRRFPSLPAAPPRLLLPHSAKKKNPHVFHQATSVSGSLPAAPCASLQLPPFIIHTLVLHPPPVSSTQTSSLISSFSSSLYCRTLATTAPCTSPR